VEIFATPSADGYALIDQVTVDLGDIEPTTTASPPEIGDEAILDTEKDAAMDAWIENTCHYQSTYKDYLNFGCDVEISDHIADEGYWTACNYDCVIKFHGPNLPQPYPMHAEISAHLSGESLLQVFLAKEGNSEDEFSITQIGAPLHGEGWKVLPVSINLTNYEEYPV